jgi:predicted ATPase/DNA-binding CsgD family transcriptional regulator
MAYHAQRVPVVQNDTLIYQKDGQDYRLEVGTPGWYAWLVTATTFAFRSEVGGFTARREQAGHKRGGWYWRAYRRRNGRLQRVYLGTSEKVTLARLRAVAATLAARPSASAEQQAILQGHSGDQEYSLRSSTGHPLPLSESRILPDNFEQHSSTLLLPLTSLIGREREVAAATTLLLRPEVRLVTLTGTGGVGKTRLSQAIASEVRDNFRDGVCFVSLSSVRDAGLVLPTIAQVLGLQGSRTRSALESLLASLRQQILLLLLDNFEQVVAAAPLLLDLLAGCPSLTILVTSREALHVRGEHIFTVRPLAVPDPMHLPERESLVRYGSVALFLERAGAVHARVEVTPQSLALISEICQHLDGLPLAIELAVARLKLLSVPGLLERLEHRLAVLTGGPRDLPVRQHTLRNTIAWSYDLLSDEEQRLFRLLSVFVGGCTLEALEQVYLALGSESTQVLEGVASLLDKHLLYRAEPDTNAPRLLMLETLREYGLEILEATGELEAARLAHARFYLGMAEEAELHLYTQRQQSWFARLEQEYENLRAALSWSVEPEKQGSRREVAWRLAGTLQWFWVTYGYVREGQHFVEQVLERDEEIETSVRAKARSGAGWLAIWQGEDVKAEALCQESLRLYRELHDRRGMASALYRLGQVASMRDDYPKSVSLLEEGVACYREVGDRIRLAYPLVSLALTLLTHADQGESSRVHSLVEESLAIFQEEHYQAGIPWSVYGLGVWYLQQGDAVRAQAAFEESLACYRVLRQRQYIAHPLYFLGKVAGQQGDLSAAHAFYQESLTLFQELDDQRSSAACLEGWASVVARQGEFIWAAQLWGAAQMLRAGGGPPALFNLPTMQGERADNERMGVVVRIELGEQAFANALAEGRAMTPEQALSAQGHTIPASHPLSKTTMSARRIDSVAPSTSPPNDLTKREMEVLRLVAQGLSDARIAEVLVISPRTVNAHLRSIYSKLDITSRHAATLFALKQQLI